jgi:circadian clock protein KaiB
MLRICCFLFRTKGGIFMTSADYQGEDTPFNASNYTDEVLRAITPDADTYVFYLYVAGVSSQSRRAIHQLRTLCNDYLPDRHDLQIIDICERPDLAEEARVIATPTLVKKLPPPLQKFIGDFTDREQILIGLDIC